MYHVLTAVKKLLGSRIEKLYENDDIIKYDDPRIKSELEEIIKLTLSFDTVFKELHGTKETVDYVEEWNKQFDYYVKVYYEGKENGKR